MSSIIQWKSKGGFGNQLFTYAFARSYAESVGAEFQSEKWVGSVIFGLNDKQETCKLPKTSLDYFPTNNKTNIKLNGYYQYEQALSLVKLANVKKWFTIKQDIVNLFPNRFGDNYIALHVRRGDYVSKYSRIFCLIKDDSYLQACDEFGLDKDKVVWVQERQNTNPIVIDGYDISYLNDFLTLMRAKVLLRGNSTFSWWASTLSGVKTYSPVVGKLTGWNDVRFIEGNAEPIIHGDNATEGRPCVKEMSIK